MKILRQKDFAQRRFGNIISRSQNIFHHYTTPKATLGISKTGLKFRDNKAGLSTYLGTDDALVGQNFHNLNEAALKGTKKLRRGTASLQNISEALKTETPLNAAEEHLKNHGVTSHLFYPSHYTAGNGQLGNPIQAYSNIDGLHTGKVGKDLTMDTVAFRKTRNPVRILINGSEIPVKKGTDVGEMVLNAEGGIISKDRLKYEIPNSGIGTRDSDIKHLRRYLKGHKGLVNPTRETMEALYGSKWPHLSKFKSEAELI
jgi:hypothetical protein